MATLDGFYLVKVGKQYYKSHGVLTDNKEEAYAFMLPHCAKGLAERLNGTVVLK
ncbi:MAG: hypothetical protein WC365_01320 [Candidatus Babeliales bacterium]|jgi:hypothetical protein